MRVSVPPGNLVGSPLSGRGVNQPQLVSRTALAQNLVASGIVGSSTMSRTLPHDESGALNPTGTTSTTFVMSGAGRILTPAMSGRIHIAVSGTLANSDATHGAKAHIYYGTGTPPANGAAFTGNAPGGTALLAPTGYTGNNVSAPFCLVAIVPLLTLGTAYWIDLAIAAIGGGTASVSNVDFSTHEF